MSYTTKNIKKIDDEIQTLIKKVIENNNLKYEISSTGMEEDMSDSEIAEYISDSSVIVDYYFRETKLNVKDQNNNYIFGGWYNVTVDKGKYLVIKDFYKNMERGDFERKYSHVLKEINNILRGIKDKNGGINYFPLEFDDEEF